MHRTVCRFDDTGASYIFLREIDGLGTSPRTSPPLKQHKKNISDDEGDCIVAVV